MFVVSIAWITIDPYSQVIFIIQYVYLQLIFILQQNIFITEMLKFREIFEPPFEMKTKTKRKQKHLHK